MSFRYPNRKKTENKQPNNVEKALQSAKNILNYADCSEQKLYEKLLARGYAPSVCAEVVSKMVKSGWLNEERQLESLCDYLANMMCYGARKVRLTLQQKGYRASLLDELDWEDFDFPEICAKRIRRTYPRFQKEDAQKVTQAMLRHGFAPSEIKTALEHVISETEERTEEEST